MIKTLSATLMLTLAFTGCKNREDVSKSPEDVLKASVKQYDFLAKQVEPGAYPKTYHATKKQLETSKSDWWCSGFFPGTMLYLDEAQGAPQLKEKALAVMEDLKREQFNTSTHDLGFMMYCSFGNAERLNPKKEYEDVLMQSAKSLITRFNKAAKCIQSWDTNNAGEMPVIIDNMMNLELLFWASKFSGDSTYRNIAITHANTTIKNHFRPDYSSYHVVVYNNKTGEVVKRVTAQGAADNSSWARGQAWGLYGYTVMYRETKDSTYLAQANHIANYILTYPTMPKNLIPYWDYQAPGIPDALHDSSAGAITASALIELSGYVDKALSTKYIDAAKTIITALSSPQYFAEQGTNGGFLLKHGVGNMPGKSEIDVPLSYGDYYFVEALMRYKKLK